MFDRELVVGSLEDILSVCEKIKRTNSWHYLWG